METHLTYDNKGEALGILVKQRLTTRNNLQIKVVGVLNTVSGQLEYCARVRKMFGVPKPRPRAAAALPADFLRTVRRSMQVGLGLAYLSGTDDILAGVSARKQIVLGGGVSPVMLKVKVQADVNTQGSQVDGVGTLQLSKTIYNFTEMQDVRGVLGCKAHVDRSGQVTPVPYASIRENNWALFFDFKGYIGARYDL